MNETRSGEIITFYSYKGGTGRTMALANTACLLTQRLEKIGQRPRVLVIDWDFEAPGLHRYFLPYLDTRTRKNLDKKLGCLDFFEALSRPKNLKLFNPRDVVGNRKVAKELVARADFDKYTVETSISGLHLMKAGKFDETYGRRVSDFDWVKFFSKTTGFFSGFADYLKENFDYVLIDSRTGVTDVSGICTALLPDKLVTVFTPNRQSLGGLEEVIRKAIDYRKQSADWRSLVVFPLQSRIEMARPSLLEQWRHGGTVQTSGIGHNLDIDEGFQPLFQGLFSDCYGLEFCDLTSYFNEVLLQHIPDYAYGEPIAVMEEKDDNRIFLRTSYQAFVDRLTELPGPWTTLDAARNEKRIREWCDEAQAMLENGAKDDALRIGLLLQQEQSHIPVELFDRVLNTWLNIVDASFPNNMAMSLLAYARSLVATQSEIDSHIYTERLSAIGDSYMHFGSYENAREIFEHLLVHIGKYTSEEDSVIVAIMNNLAATRRELGDLSGARELLEKSLNTCRRVAGEENVVTLSIMNNLALTLTDQRDFVRARELQERTLDIQRRLLGEEHQNTLTSMNNLASTLRYLGDLSGARLLHEKELDICRKVLGEEHPDTLVSMNNLALTLREQNNFSDAIKLQEKELEICRRVQGEEHPDTLISMNNLATTLQAQNNLPSARLLLEQTLDIRRRVLGNEHPDVLSTLFYLLNTVEKLGDMAAAIKYREELSGKLSQRKSRSDPNLSVMK